MHLRDAEPLPSHHPFKHETRELIVQKLKTESEASVPTMTRGMELDQTKPLRWVLTHEAFGGNIAISSGIVVDFLVTQYSTDSLVWHADETAFTAS